MLTDSELSERCHKIVTQVLERHAWRLIEPAELTQQVLARAQEAGQYLAGDLRSLAINHYSQLLYHTCRLPPESESETRHAQAFAELGRYLYAFAYNRCREAPQDAADATQEALVCICKTLASGGFKKPDAFLAGCIWKLRGALKKQWRRDKMGGQEPLSLEDEIQIEDVSDAEVDRVPAELQQAVWQELRRKFTLHPRAGDQLEAALRKLLDESSNPEIAAALGVASPAAVSNLIARGKEKLAKNKELRDLYVRWFLEEA